jgi:hypothetical protein
MYAVVERIDDLFHDGASVPINPLVYAHTYVLRTSR